MSAGSFGKKLRLWVGLVLVALVAILILQNTESVETSFLFASIVMPRAALLALTLLVGIVIGVVLGYRFGGRSDDSRGG